MSGCAVSLDAEPVRVEYPWRIKCPTCGWTDTFAHEEVALLWKQRHDDDHDLVVWCPSCGDESPRNHPHTCPPGTVPYESEPPTAASSSSPRGTAPGGDA